MNDTAIAVAALVAKRHRSMTPADRLQAAASLFEIGRAIVESSLPAGIPRAERRLRLARRLYSEDLPEAALAAFAAFDPPPTLSQPSADSPAAAGSMAATPRERP